jgi:hypothetical protein
MTTLPFVISTEAKRSGEISVWMLLLGNVFDRRSELEGAAGFSSEIDYNRTLGLAHKDATFFNGW